MTNVRTAAVAGAFYPLNTQELQSDVNHLLQQASSNRAMPRPKAIIAPHAGYIYSGPCAAKAYYSLQPYANHYQKVVLLGPSHRVGFRGIATCSADYYETPLGLVPVDKQATRLAQTCDDVSCFDQAHLMEHSLEVHLPFLQTVLKNFELIPLVVGDCETVSCARVINKLWGDSHTLLVVSSDLSHFLDYASAKAIDERTCKAIETFNGDTINDHQACGRNPVKGLLKAAKSHSLAIKTLCLCNSGDTAGDKQRVVGYGSWALWEGSEHD